MPQADWHVRLANRATRRREAARPPLQFPEGGGTPPRPTTVPSRTDSLCDPPIRSKHETGGASRRAATAAVTSPRKCGRRGHETSDHWLPQDGVRVNHLPSDQPRLPCLACNAKLGRVPRPAVGSSGGESRRGTHVASIVLVSFGHLKGVIRVGGTGTVIEPIRGESHADDLPSRFGQALRRHHAPQLSFASGPWRWAD